MQHTIELNHDAELKLKELAGRTGRSEDDLLHETVAARLNQLDTSYSVAPIRITKDVMGGDACIRDTRIPVWLLVQYKRQGMTDGGLLQCYPTLNASDLIAVWDYFAAHSEDIEMQMRQHDEAA